MGIQKRIRAWLFLLAGAALATATSAVAEEYCTPTARNQLTACRGETTDDYYTAIAICLNESNSGDRAKCNREAARIATTSPISATTSSRRGSAICARIGEGRYDPDFDEQNFVSDFAHPGISNPYFPIAIGNTGTTPARPRRITSRCSPTPS
jgi:hypothetical protein